MNINLKNQSNIINNSKIKFKGQKLMLLCVIFRVIKCKSSCKICVNIATFFTIGLYFASQWL